MVYGICKGGSWGVGYCAIVVCKSIEYCTIVGKGLTPLTLRDANRVTSRRPRPSAGTSRRLPSGSPLNQPIGRARLRQARLPSSLHLVCTRLDAARSLAFTRYCHQQYSIVYGILTGGRWEGVYCAMVVQQYCNRVCFASGGGATIG